MKDLVSRIRIEAEAKGDDKISAIASELERLAQDAGDAAPKLTELADGLRQMAHADAAITAFSAVRREVQNTESELSAAAQAVDTLAERLSAAADATRDTAAAQAASAQRLAEARAHHESLRDAVRDAKSELQALRGVAHDAGTSTGELGERVANAETRLSSLKSKASEAAAAALDMAQAAEAAAADLKSLRAAAKEHGDATGEYAEKIAETKGQLAILKAESKSAAMASKEIAQEAKAAAIDLKSLQDAAKSDAMAAHTREVEAAEQRLSQMRTAAQAAGGAVRDLATEHTAAQAASQSAERDQRRLATEYDRAVAGAGKLSGELGRQRHALDAARDALRAAGVDTAGLADSQIELKARLLEAQRQAQGYVDALTELRAESASLSPAMEGLFKKLGIRAVRDITTEIEQLQTAMRGLRDQKLLPEDAARASAELTRRVEALRAELKGTAPVADQTAGRIDDLGNASQGAGNKIGAAAHKVALWTAALVGIHSASDLARQVIETGSAFEQLEARLANILGSTEAASSAFAEIKALATETPFAVQDLADSFTKLAAFGLVPTRDQMMALADTAATLGGGTEALAGVTLALGQAWTKGKLQGEEMLQLAERGVPVWDLLSAATGRNVAELQQMASAGKLGREAILQLLDAMGSRNAGAGAELMAKYAGAVSNARDAMAEFFDLIAQSGVLDYLAEQIRDLLDEFDRMKDSGELERTARDIADGFIYTAEAVNGVIAVLSALSPVIEAAFKLWAAKKILDVVSAWNLLPASATTAAVATEAASARVVMANERMAASANLAAAAWGGMLKLVRLAGWAAVAGEILDVTTAYIELQRQLDRNKKLAADRDATAAALAERYRELSERTRVSVRDTNEFNAAIAAGKLVFSEAEGRWISAARAAELLATGLRQTGKSARELSEIEIETRRFRLSELQAQLIAAQGAAGGVAAALKQMFDSADLGSFTGIEKLSADMVELRNSALATAEQLDQGLAERLRALSQNDLADFAVMAESSFSRGAVAAREFGQMMDGQLRETLRRAGVDASMVFDGMGAASLEAIASLDGVIGSLDRLQDRGVETGRVVESALVKAFSAADSQRAIDEITARMESLGLSAANTGDAISRAMRAAQARVEDLTPGIQSAEEAYRRLGIQSKAALAEQAKGLREAYDYLVKSGAAIDDQAAAWAIWADAAIAANGGVATATMQSEAATRGYVIVVDEAGKAQIRLKQAVEDTGRAAVQAAAAATEAVERQTAEMVAAQRAASGGIGRMQDSINDFHAHLTALGDGLAGHINFTRQATFDAVNGSVEAMKLFEAAAKEGAARVMNIGGVIEAYYKSMDFVIGRYAEQTQHAAAMTEALQQRIDETAGAVDRSSNSLADQIKLVEQTMDRVNLLGDQDLAPLRRALDDAKSRMRALRDEASDTLATIQDEWDRLHNNLDEIERRRAVKREAELKAQLAAAQAAGDREAIANLEKALRLLKQINAENIKAAEAEEKARRNRDSGGTTSTGDRTGGITRGGGGTSAPTPTPTPAPTSGGGVHFHIGGILDVNDRATLDTLARKLKPVIGDLDRKGF